MPKGPSIYYNHTEGEAARGYAQVGACGQGGTAPCGRPHRKLEPTDAILSSSHAKKLAFFAPEFRLWAD